MVAAAPCTLQLRTDIQRLHACCGGCQSRADGLAVLEMEAEMDEGDALDAFARTWIIAIEDGPVPTTMMMFASGIAEDPCLECTIGA